MAVTEVRRRFDYEINAAGAVVTFGYFDKDGKIVYSTSSVGFDWKIGKNTVIWL